MSIEEELERFVEFGGILDRKMRQYLSRYIAAKISPNTLLEVPELNDQYFRYFKDALDEIFAIDHLLPLTQQHERISQQMVRDILRWLKKSYHKARQKNEQLEEEANRLENWAITPLHRFVERWDVLINYLRREYNTETLDTSFYAKKFKTLIQGRSFDTLSPEARKEIEIVFHDLLAQWDALLHAKMLRYELSKLDEAREHFTQTLQAKVDEFQQLSKIISPFAEYVGRYWDMSRELWQDSSFEIVKHYDELLQNEDSIRELADLLGQMREAEIEIEEEEYEKVIVRREWVKDPNLRSEIAGIHESDDLNNLLSAEASLLGDTQTEWLFLKRFADKRLLTFQYEDKRLVKSEHNIMEVEQKTKRKEQGPFIICVDTSESMHGRPEQIAKVLCLGILKMAAAQNRSAYLINFSTGVQTIDLFNIADSIDAVAKFLQMSFYGGTDISLPLYEALRQLEGHRYEDADILVISDFIMYKIEDEVVQRVRHFQHNQGTQFHSLTLSADPNSRILEYFDTNWLYDPNQKGIIKSLTQQMHQTLNR